MEIRVSPDLDVTLHHPDDLKRFKMVIALDRAHQGKVEKALAGVAQLESAEAAWVSVAWLREQSRLEQSPEWNAGFSAMLDYAGQHGWLRENASQVRSHVEWRDPAPK